MSPLTLICSSGDNAALVPAIQFYSKNTLLLHEGNLINYVQKGFYLFRIYVHDQTFG